MNNYRNKGYRGNRSRYPQHKKKPYSFQWNEQELVKTIEHYKDAPKIVSNTAYNATNTIDTLDVDFQLKQNIYAKGYKVLTPIQDQAIPFILGNNDIIGIANTGTGKTAAFLIPLVNKVIKDRTQKVLVIAPTRELAEQINEEFKLLALNLRVFSTLIIGGQNIRTQILGLRRNPNFVIGTPGRIKDLINRHQLNLGNFNNVVLDETDRMVDIGFIKEIKTIISLLPNQRQSLFFSATVSKKVEEIIRLFVKNPITISVKKQDTNANIQQNIVRVPKHIKKVDQLHDLLISQGFEKVLVFGNTKWGVQKLATELINRGFKADAIHGNKRQNQRKTILENFKKNKISILLATDVAARGLDIENVSHVINYDIPNSYNEYIHRIGRTGRAEKTGTAITFIGA